MEIRKIVVISEETFIEGKKEVKIPTRKVAVAAVIKNPYCDIYQEDLSALIRDGGELANILAEKGRQALNMKYEEIESYGKAAIVGEDGELEHAAALIHPGIGPSMKKIFDSKAMMPGTKKRGGLGTTIDIPLGYMKAAYVRSHFDAIEMRIPDAPKRDEIIVAVAFADSGRSLARIGGLKKEDVKGLDGLY